MFRSGRQQEPSHNKNVYSVYLGVTLTKVFTVPYYYGELGDRYYATCESIESVLTIGQDTTGFTVRCYTFYPFVVWDSASKGMSNKLRV